jgi:hypothetical protein
MMKVSEFLKAGSLLNAHGLSWYDFDDCGIRGISMDVVKIDEAVPDWDTYEVQYGKSNPETWVGIRWNFICSDEVNQHDESR